MSQIETKNSFGHYCIHKNRLLVPTPIKINSTEVKCEDVKWINKSCQYF